MLVLYVVFVAAVVRTFKGPRVGVRVEVIPEAGRTVKGLRAAGPGACQGLEVGRELGPRRGGRRGRRRGVDYGAGRRVWGEVVVAIIEIW